MACCFYRFPEMQSCLDRALKIIEKSVIVTRKWPGSEFIIEETRPAKLQVIQPSVFCSSALSKQRTVYIFDFFPRNFAHWTAIWEIVVLASYGMFVSRLGARPRSACPEHFWHFPVRVHAYHSFLRERVTNCSIHFACTAAWPGWLRNGDRRRPILHG